MYYYVYSPSDVLKIPEKGEQHVVLIAPLTMLVSLHSTIREHATEFGNFNYFFRIEALHFLDGEGLPSDSVYLVLLEF